MSYVNEWICKAKGCGAKNSKFLTHCTQCGKKK